MNMPKETKCTNCGGAFEGTVEQCFMHDGKFCKDCEPCSVHDAKANG